MNKANLRANFARPSLIALALLAAATISAQAQGQADDHAAILAEIDASLPGTLINDPTSLDWRVAGGRLTTEAVVDDTIPGGGAATQYEIRRAGDNPWDIQVYVPLTRDIAAGETVTFGFWARTLESRGDGGLGKVTARIQRDASPWPGFGDTPFSIGAEWRWYEATTTSDIRIEQAEAFLVLQLAAERQTVQIGQAFMVSDAEQIMGNGARPPEPLPPQLAGRGQLLSQPDSREWGFLGPDGSYEARDDATIYLGRAVQFTSPSASDEPWSIQASVPLSQPIAAGEELEVAIAAKTVSAATDDGKARIGIRLQENAAPFDGFGDNIFSVGENWQMIRIRTTATMDMPAGSAQVALHFAGAEQVVDVGPAYVIRLNPDE